MTPSEGCPLLADLVTHAPPVLRYTLPTYLRWGRGRSRLAEYPAWGTAVEFRGGGGGGADLAMACSRS